jgi:hypothetical protein
MATDTYVFVCMSGSSSVRPGGAEITAVMDLLQETLVVGDLYDRVEPQAQPDPPGAAHRTASSVYRLTGLVCYYGLHYVGAWSLTSHATTPFR